MNFNNLKEYTFGLQTDLVNPTSLNFRLPSFPPPCDWPVVIDAKGTVVSRWSDSRWDIGHWNESSGTLNFTDNSHHLSKPLDPENAVLMKMIAAWLIWGPRAPLGTNTLQAAFSNLRQVVALCSRNGISAAKLMHFPKVLAQVPKVISSSNYKYTLAHLHRLYDARETVGFVIVNPAGLKLLAEAAPNHDVEQTPYIPPRIWMYQIKRLHECLRDFLAHQEEIEACFRYCLNIYINHYGSLQATLKSGDGNRKTSAGSPFNITFRYRESFPGTFPEVAERFGIAKLLSKWCIRNERVLGIDMFSSYLTTVSYAGLMYVANYTLQRKEEVGALRADCLIWEDDSKIGRVPIICGETTKTDPDSDARWVASPSVEVAVQALSVIAFLRMECDRANPVIRPTIEDQANPYLFSTATEPWGGGLAKASQYSIRAKLNILSRFRQIAWLLKPEQMRITGEDLELARRLSPNISEEIYSVGKVWPLNWHQYRRTGAVNMFASGIISDSTIQQQMKHSTQMMSFYYGRNYSQLHFNEEVRATVVEALYQSQAAAIKSIVSDDRFVSPHMAGRRETLAINVLSAKDTKDLIAMMRRGTVTFREHRLGGCMVAGVCEYGGIESIARCAGGDGGEPCAEVVYDRKREPQVHADMRRIEDEIKRLPVGSPRYIQRVMERQGMENYLNAIKK